MDMYRVTNDDCLSKAELQSIKKGLEDIKKGRTYKMQKGESITDFLKRVMTECKRHILHM